jgi:hypothetical protein
LDARKPSDGHGIIGGVDRFDFDAELWLWDARRSDTWVFLSVPPEVSVEIAERAAMRPRSGFGSVRVEVRIGSTVWRTSVFPAAHDRYVLPVKKSVRAAEDLEPGDIAPVHLELA